MGIGSAITTRLGNDADCIRRIDPLLRRQGKAFNRASFLNPSNSRGLKSGLYKQLFATENSIGLFRRDDER